MTTQLGMFAKYWQPGAVKTRLATSIGDEAAAALHREFVQSLLSRFRDVADRQILCFSPPAEAEKFQKLDLGPWTLEPQSTGDLGQRMRSHFSRTLERSTSSRAVLIGSDSPDLPLPFLEEAFLKLKDHGVVLGPALDGGYYLIGLSQEVPPIFDGISWSSPEVWTQTIARLAAAGIPYHVLPEWYDVDDLPSLERLQKSLSTDESLRQIILSHLSPDL